MGALLPRPSFFVPFARDRGRGLALHSFSRRVLRTLRTGRSETALVVDRRRARALLGKVHRTHPVAPAAMSTFREKAGALFHDWLPFELRLRRGWTRIRNRDERVDIDASGVRCDWRWTSDLHIARVFPPAGLRLMRTAFAQWPIAFADDVPRHERPRVSFIIGHRGLERLPHLLKTIRSIAGQRDAAVECIVVEQAEAQQAREHLPAGVRYVHTPVPVS